MTESEAIKWLQSIEKKYIHGGDEEFDRLRKVAISMAISAFTRINQLEAEIERVTTSFPKTLKAIEKMYNTAKSEAIKEFAKFLIDKSEKGVISTSDIPEYVIEMVGDTE